jgi:hypothetical protein
MIKGQQGLIGEIVKSKSSNMGSKKGKPNQYKGLPLKYFEAMSYLERVCEWYTNVPYFLASDVIKNNKDPIFRMKQTVRAILSTVYMTVKPSKPFNPILGESYQGYMCLDSAELLKDGRVNENCAEYQRKRADDSEVGEVLDGADIFKMYAEQTSHHPPISNFLITSKLVQIHGHFEQKGSLNKNSYLIQNKGVCHVTFLDTKQTIKYSLPDVVMTGLFFGTQQLQLNSSLIFHDEANKLKAHVSFDNSGGASKRFKDCEDKKANMYGLVYTYDSSKGAKVDPSVPLSKMTDIATEHEQLWGNWQGYLQNKDAMIWDLDQTVDSSTLGRQQLKRMMAAGGEGRVLQAKNLATPNCIPSDCRNREDLIWIRQEGRTAEAEQWKQYLEEQQRKEEKLRKAAKKK